MKIAHVVCTFPPYRGGMGNSAYYFAKHVVNHNHQVTVFTTDYGKEIADLENSNLEVIRLKPILKIGSGAVLLQLLWKLPKFDVIHLHYPFYGSAELVALLKIILPRKIKLVLHYHMDNQADGWKGAIFDLYKKFFLPIILRLSDEITCASLDYIKHSNAGNYFKKHQRKFTQVPFGVNTKEFKPREANEESENNDVKKIIFVGALDKQHYFKGVSNLLKAFAQLIEDNKELELIIVGNGDLQDYYHQLAKDLKVDKQVTFKHGADDCAMIDCYQQANFLVLPSINKSEAFGIVLLEAMACGKPVVASNLPGVRSVFKNNKQGLLTKPNNIDDLVFKMKRLIENKHLTKRLGESARELVERNYTWEKAGEKLNIVYHRVKNIPKL